MANKTGRKYGLILKKKPTSVQVKPSIFGGDDSGDDEESGRKIVNVTIRKEAEKNKQMRQTQLEINKVLEDDPTAYDYDAVYDKMAERKANILAAKTATANRKPKYIGNLLKFAEVRKKEDERRVERQVQKERETEGNEFEDKDSFVTSAYRQKMQEMAEEEERQRKRDERDGDVTKQADLTMFYRNLLDRNVSTGGSFNTEQNTESGEEKVDQSRQSQSPGRNERKTEQAQQSSDDEKKRTNPDRRSDGDSHRGDSHRGDRKAEDEYDKIKTKSNKQSMSEKTKLLRYRDRTPEKSRQHEKRERRHNEQKSKHEQQKHQNEQAESALQANVGSEKHKTELCIKRLNNETCPKTEKDSEDIANVERKKVCKNLKKIEEKKSVGNKFAKHTSTDTVMSARERYVARKKTRVVVVQPGSDDED